jgi:hypothetical protein
LVDENQIAVGVEMFIDRERSREYRGTSWASVEVYERGRRGVL